MPTHPFYGYVGNNYCVATGRIDNVFVFDPCPRCGSENLHVMMDIGWGVRNFLAEASGTYMYCTSCDLKWRDNEVLDLGKTTCDDQR